MSFGNKGQHFYGKLRYNVWIYAMQQNLFIHRAACLVVQKIDSCCLNAEASIIWVYQYNYSFLLSMRTILCMCSSNKVLFYSSQYALINTIIFIQHIVTELLFSRVLIIGLFLPYNDDNFCYYCLLFVLQIRKEVWNKDNCFSNPNTFKELQQNINECNN